MGALAGIVSLAVIIIAVPSESSNRGGECIIPLRFGSGSDASLIRRLDSTGLNENAEIVTTDRKTGLAVAQRYRWLPGPKLLHIESTLRNAGKGVATASDVRLLDWGFRIGQGHDAGRYRALSYRDEVWYDSTYWTGPDWTRVGKNWHHPGTDTPSVRRFTAPRDGRITIVGRVYKGDTKNGGGDGVRVFIRHDAKTVWEGTLDGDDAKGLEPKLTLDVRKDDALRFVVHKRGKIYCDTTYWDPVVTYADGDRYQASEGFATSKQGAGGWSYEMETDPNAKAQLPTLHGYRTDLSLSETTLTIGAPARLTQDTALPLLVLTDDADRSGIVVALSHAGPWRAIADFGRDGRLALSLVAGNSSGGFALEPGKSLRLPDVVIASYEGPWLQGIAELDRVLSTGQDVPGLALLRESVTAGFRRLSAQTGSPRRPSLMLWTLIQADWRQQDKLTDQPDSYTAAAARHLERAGALLKDLRNGQPSDFLAEEAREIERLASDEGRSGDLDRLRSRYLRVRWLKRRIALSNPLMGFERLLLCKRVPTSYSHLVMQYYGWRARPGGGIFVLDDPGYSLDARDILAGKLEDGNVLEPRLSYDAKRIVFSFVRNAGKEYDYNKLDNTTDDGFYHIHEVNVDGTGLRQLTSGPYDDVMPTCLPDGGIAFCSTRRRGYARCFGAQFSRRWHVYTLHRVDGDGTNLRTISFNDVNEWFPTVSNTGLVFYSRWDYIDRDAVTHQNLWATRPDGTNPIAVWGNATSTPHCTFQMQPIPHSSKIVFTASAHHSVTGGSIAIVDPDLGVDGQQAITRITPEVPFPEAEGREINEYYAAPWPLSEKYFLVAYSPRPLVWEPGANHRDALGIYLLDAAGNRELIYRDPDIGSTNPCPLAPRPCPPVIKSGLPDEPEPTGEMVVLDVYEGLGDVPRGTVKELRIVQIFPKSTHVANTPPIGMAREENGRAVLGTVPVEADGSARFLVPARKPVLFQALDKDGLAVQMMRSLTYVQPGERVSCIGCHERRTTAPGAAVALKRPPSEIKPGPFDGQPFSYVRVVQPVLDKHCVRCHGGDKPKKGMDLTGRPHKEFTRSYLSLCGNQDFIGDGTNPKTAAEALVPRFGARNQIQVTPVGGIYGARGSRLIKMLRKGHQDVKLTTEDLRRLAMWIDCNAIFYGANKVEEQARQLRGEILAMPEIQ
ncbi:MAG: hypothetical protein JXQ73_08975 [Phycisphaerae bacterium]|nr:hypothetical protein [Phycisphaerae bacterium]